MSEISKISTAFQWSISKMAEALGMSRNTVSKRLREANVSPAGTERGSPVYALKDAMPALYQNDTPTVGGLIDPNQMPPEMRKAWFQSENERLKFEKTESQLCGADDVARNMAQLAKSVIQVLETLPDILERDCALQPAQVAKVQAAIDDMRDQLAIQAAYIEPEPEDVC